MSKVVLGNLVIDRDRYEASVGARRVRLTFVEFELLWELSRRAPSVVPRRQLMLSVWRQPAGSSSRKINTQICRLRQKLSGSDWLIETHSKRGYALACSQPEEAGVRNGALAGFVAILGGIPAQVSRRLTPFVGQGPHLHMPSTALLALGALLLSLALLGVTAEAPVLSRRLVVTATSFALLLAAGVSAVRAGAGAHLRFLLPDQRREPA